MGRIPDKKKIPKWISDYVPREIAESRLFRFEIRLQTVDCFKCADCGAEYSYDAKACTADQEGMACGGKIKVVRKQITVDLLPDLDLEYDILEDQMQTLPAQYAFWASVYSEARLLVAIEERRVKATRGKVVEEVQKRLAKDQVKLSTELVKQIVEADKQTDEAELRLNMAHMRCGKLHHMLEALKMKAELARSLAGFKRQEQDKS